MIRKREYVGSEIFCIILILSIENHTDGTDCHILGLDHIWGTKTNMYKKYNDEQVSNLYTCCISTSAHILILPLLRIYANIS